MNGTTLRDGIFALHTRRFGSVAEVMIQRLIQAAKARSLFHDLYDDNQKHRIEVKFSRIQKPSETTVTEATVLQCIAEATAANRMVPFSQWQQFNFDSNIQQIKRTEFEILYYGLFFADCVKIFRIESSQIGSQINYCDVQHKGNKGEGQFHVTHRTLAVHLRDYYHKSLDYDELYQLLT